MSIFVSCGQKKREKKTTAATPLNVVFILTDDKGAHLSAPGTKGLSTPNIDNLAKEGKPETFRSGTLKYIEALKKESITPDLYLILSWYAELKEYVIETRKNTITYTVLKAIHLLNKESKNKLNSTGFTEKHVQSLPESTGRFLHHLS